MLLWFWAPCDATMEFELCMFGWKLQPNCPLTFSIQTPSLLLGLKAYYNFYQSLGLEKALPVRAELCWISHINNYKAVQASERRNEPPECRLKYISNRKISAKHD